MSEKNMETLVNTLLNVYQQMNTDQRISNLQELDKALSARKEISGFEEQIYNILKIHLHTKTPDILQAALNIFCTCLRNKFLKNIPKPMIVHITYPIIFACLNGNEDTLESQELWLKCLCTIELLTDIYTELCQTRSPHLLSIIQKAISFNCTNSVQKLQAIKMLESFVSVGMLEEHRDSTAEPFYTLYWEHLIPLIATQNNEKIQNIGLPIVETLLPDFLLTLRKFPDKWEAILLDIRVKYIDAMTSFIENGNCYFAKVWIHLINLIGTKFHKGSPIINEMLSCLETAFKTHNLEIRKHAFFCWQVLIDCFAVDPNEMYTEKRIRLLTIPLKTNNGKTEELVRIKIDTWCKLIEILHVNNLNCLFHVLELFLYFCFGNLSAMPLIYYKEGTEGATSQGKKFPNVHLQLIKVYLQIIGHEKYISDDLKSKLTFLKSKGPIIKHKHFEESSKKIINAVGECCVMLSDMENCDAFERAHINEALWKSLFYFIDTLVHNQALKLQVMQEVSKLILALISVTRRKEHLISFGVKSVFNIITSGEFEFFKHEKISELLFIPMMTTVFRKDRVLLKHDVIAIFKKIFIFKRNDDKYLDFIQASNSLLLRENVTSEHKLVMLSSIWYVLEAELQNNLLHTKKDNIIDELYTNVYYEFFIWPVSNTVYFKNSEKIIKKWKELYELYGKFTNGLLQNKLGSLLTGYIRDLISKHTSVVVIAELVYFIVFNLKLSVCKEDNCDNICSIYEDVNSIVSLPQLSPEVLNIYETCIAHILDTSSVLPYLHRLLVPINGCLKSLLDIHGKSGILQPALSFVTKIELNNDKLKPTLDNLIQLLEKHKKISEEKVTSSTVDDTKLNKVQKEQTVFLLGHDINTMTPVKFKGSLIKEQKSSTSKSKDNVKASTSKLSNSEVVVVNSSYKFDPSKLTKQQREKMSRRRDDIPALYQDLSQSRTQDFNTNSESFVEPTSETVQTEADGTSTEQVDKEHMNSLNIPKQDVAVIDHNYSNCTSNYVSSTTEIKKKTRLSQFSEAEYLLLCEQINETIEDVVKYYQPPEDKPLDIDEANLEEELIEQDDNVDVEEISEILNVSAAVEETPLVQNVSAAIEETPVEQNLSAAVEETPVIQNVSTAVEEIPVVQNESIEETLVPNEKKRRGRKPKNATCSSPYNFVKKLQTESVCNSDSELVKRRSGRGFKKVNVDTINFEENISNSNNKTETNLELKDANEINKLENVPLIEKKPGKIMFNKRRLSMGPQIQQSYQKNRLEYINLAVAAAAEPTENASDLEKKKLKVQRELNRLNMDIKHSEEYLKTDKRKTRTPLPQPQQNDVETEQRTLKSKNTSEVGPSNKKTKHRSFSPKRKINFDVELLETSNNVAEIEKTACVSSTPKNIPVSKVASEKEMDVYVDVESDLIQSSQENEPEISLKQCQVSVLKHPLEQIKPGEQMSINTGINKIELTKGPQPSSPFKVSLAASSTSTTKSTTKTNSESEVDKNLSKMDVGIENMEVVFLDDLKTFEEVSNGMLIVDNLNSQSTEISTETQSVPLEVAETTSNNSNFKNRKVLLDNSILTEEDSNKIPVTPIKVNKPNTLPTSPVSNDTPTRNKELLNNTSEISPIKNVSKSSSTEEKAVENSPILFESEQPSNPVSEQSADIEKLSGNSSNYNNQTNSRKRSKVIVGRSAKMMKMISAKPTVISESHDNSKPATNKMNSYTSPLITRTKKMLNQLEKQDSTALKNSDPATISPEEVFQFEKHLPSLEAKPGASILKRKREENDESVDETTSKKRRVNFSDPPVSSMKFFEKTTKTIKTSSKLKETSPINSEVLEQNIENIKSVISTKLTTFETFTNNNMIPPVYENLINCQEPITTIISQLMTSFDNIDSVSALLESMNIQTIGDLAKLTELQVMQIPIEVQAVKSILNEYENKLKDKLPTVKQKRRATLTTISTSNKSRKVSVITKNQENVPETSSNKTDLIISEQSTDKSISDQTSQNTTMDSVELALQKIHSDEPSNASDSITGNVQDEHVSTPTTSHNNVFDRNMSKSDVSNLDYFYISPTSLKDTILNEEINGTKIMKIIQQIRQLLIEKTLDPRPLMRALFANNPYILEKMNTWGDVINYIITSCGSFNVIQHLCSKKNIPVVMIEELLKHHLAEIGTEYICERLNKKDLTKFVAKECNLIDIIQQSEKESVQHTLFDLASNSEYSHFNFFEMLKELHSSIIKLRMQPAEIFSGLNVVEIGDALIERMVDNNDIDTFLKHIYDKIPANIYNKPAQAIMSANISQERSDQEMNNIGQNVCELINASKFSKDVELKILEALAKKWNAFEFFRVLNFQNKHSAE